MWLNNGDRVKVYDKSMTWEAFGTIGDTQIGCVMCDDPDCENAEDVTYRIELGGYGELEFTTSDMQYHGLTVIKLTS